MPTRVNDLWTFFRFRVGMPVDYVIDMLRNLLRSERIRDRWRMAFDALRRNFTLNFPNV